MYTRRFFAAPVLLLGLFASGCASTPPYQGLEVDQLFQLGTQEFAEEDWDEAIRVFERFIFADPAHPRIVEARLYLARAYYNREDYLTAVTEFSRIVDRHPGDRLAPEAALGICKSYAALSPHIQRDQTPTLQAFNACNNVLQDFEGLEIAQEARQIRDEMREKLARKDLMGGEFYFRRKLFDSAIIYFNDVVSQYPGAEATAQALLRLHQAYTEIGWEAEAEQARERLLREFPDSEEAREVRANGGGEGGGSAFAETGGGI